jgi:hypothetical protein
MLLPIVLFPNPLFTLRPDSSPSFFPFLLIAI